jgi:DegV family protein with EDD domain
MSIRIITDSASDIPWDYAKEKNVEVVSLTVSYHNETYTENEEFDLLAYYEHFKEKKFFPKTAQPSPAEFFQAYEKVIEEGAKDILVITISSGLSGTFNSARLAGDMLSQFHEGISLHIVDSLNASFPEVFLVDEALDLIEKGLKVEEIAEKLRLLVTKLKTFILLPSLNHLHAGGRISTPKYVLARLLKKKPITVVNSEGKNEVATSVTKVEKGVQELVRLTTEDYTIKPRRLCIVKTGPDATELADMLVEELKEHLPDVPYIIILSGVSISAHTGSGCISLVSDFGNLLE